METKQLTPHLQPSAHATSSHLARAHPPQPLAAAHTMTPAEREEEEARRAALRAKMSG
jgi:hypothetical protein